MSDNLNTFPVHRIEGTATTPLGPIPSKTNLYSDQNIYQYGINGPFLQTLFLGCSVVNFNVNLGWGEEASSLSVSLVEDKSNHWLSSESISLNNSIDVSNNIAINNPLFDINSKQTFNAYNRNTPKPHALQNLGNDTAYYNANNPDNSVRDFKNDANVSPDLHRNILLKEEQKFNEAIEDNSNRLFGSPARPDYGKVYYRILYNGVVEKRYWTGPDPGFVGESYDILGTPVRFIFNEFEFVGIVTSWKNNGSSGGKNLYTVEIKSFSSLLKNTQLIIDHYAGSLFRKTKQIPQPFSLLSKFGLPSNNTINVGFYQNDTFVGNIAEGGIPNVFNIYGYLEETIGWAKHDINEQGTMVRDILVGISDLINKTQIVDNNPDSPFVPNAPNLIDPRFSPYGRIIGKAPALSKSITNQLSSDIPNSLVRFLKDDYIIVNPFDHEFYKLVEIESEPIAYQQLSRVDYSQNATINGVNTQPLNLNDMGLLPAYTSSDGFIRQEYRIDLSDLPSVPSGYKIKGPVISIMDLVQNVCEINNYDYFVDFDAKYNAIKIKTISRQNQPPNNYIAQAIKNSAATDSITSYDYGLEFNDSANIRSLYIGGNQQRLLQLSSNLLSRKNNGLLFDPKEGMLLQHDLSNIKNVFRAPDHFSLRNPEYKYYRDLTQIDQFAGSGTGSIVYEEPIPDRFGWNVNVGGGNYCEPVKYINNSEWGGYKNSFLDKFYDKASILFHNSSEEEINQGNNLSAESIISYPIWDDFICPYFGNNPDGTIRKVYFDSAMQQLQILCNITDIENILGHALLKEANISAKRTKQDDTNADGADRLPYDLVNGYSQEQLAELNNPSFPSAQAAGNLRSETQNVETFHTQWNLLNKEYYTKDSEFVILENEIRAAIAGFDSWVFYTFNKTFVTDLGRMLRLTMMTPTGIIVSEQSQDDPTTKAINEGEPVVTMVYHGSEPHIIGNIESANPNSSVGILNDRISDMLQKVHSYVKNIGDTYYGKQFMVKVPGLSISRDRPLSSESDFPILYEDQSFNVEEYKGAGKLYSNYKPATDGAWEEPGNIIDDTIIVGSITGSFFTNDDGRFGPILGYKASYEYLNDTIPDEAMDNTTKPDKSAILPQTDQVEIVDEQNNFTNFKAKMDSTTWVASAILDNLPPDQNAEEPEANPPTLMMILAQSSQPATGVDIIPNEWYPGLVTSLSNSEYLYYPYNFPSYPYITELYNFTFANINDMTSATFDNPETSTQRRVPTSNQKLGEHLAYKIYARAEIEPDFFFIRTDTWYTETESDSDFSPTAQKPNPNFREPRAILKISSPIECNPVHLADKYVYHCFKLDSIVFKMRGVSIPPEVRRIGGGTFAGGLVNFSGGFSASPDIITQATDHFLEAINAVDKDADKAVTMPIAPKAAIPGFAAVPLQSKGSVYGPWTNYPWLVRKDIFTDPDIRNNDTAMYNSVNNLVGGLKVEIAEDLCPWNFGGMKNLDMEAVARLESDASYQISQEYGTFSIPGSPVYKLGDFLDKVSEYTSGPIINSIRANISDGGVSTEYSLRTFSRKFGLFNKENANRAAQISLERIARRKAIAQQAAEVDNRRISLLKSTTLNDAPKRDYTNPPLPESWRSSSELLIGHNDISFRLPLKYRITQDKTQGIKEGIQNISGLVNYDPSWGFAPRWLSPNGSGVNVLEFPKIFSNTQIMDSRESAIHLQGDYENTSFMSLDGLLSPISFYPTENFRTYHISKYPRNACRYCFGKGSLDYSIGLPGLLNSLSASDPSNLNSETTKEATKTKIPCPFCEPEIKKIDQMLAGTSRGRAIPPFILTSGVDSSDEHTSANLGSVDGITTYKTAGVVINYSTLNPAVLSFGEFSNFQNRQKGDYTGHSIRMIGHSTIPPNRSADSLNQMMCGDNRLAKTNLEYDQLYLDKIKELSLIPENKRTENIKKILNKVPTNTPRFANNARFFGLRGPLMLHGWGYDTEGYPIPNSSGEPKYQTDPDDDSRLIPIVCNLLDDPTVKIKVYKNQEFIEIEDINSDLTEDKIIVSFTNTDDGTTKNGYWTEPYRETTFAKGWAQTPSTWPVGPMDLRWDRKGKVWTMPSTYQNVYVLLEEDLNKNVARGELIDNAQDLDDALKPLGYRKVVYVRDTMGIYGAPRSAIIYCAYDQDSGFYEPVSQSSFSTSGEIISSTTVNLYKIYQRKIPMLGNTTTNENESATYTATFSNPLDMNVNPGDIALFTFLRDGWVVQAGRS